MRREFLVCTVCLVAVVAIADEISPKIRKVIELGEIRRKERISELEGGLKVIKGQYEKVKKEANKLDGSSMTQPTGRRTSAAELKAAADKEMDGLKARASAALQEIATIKAQKYYSPNITLKTMRVGDVGILVDEFGSLESAKITQIVDGESAIISVGSQSIWLTVDTEGLKVGKKFNMTMPFEVTGTTTHKSVGSGSKKMFVLEQFFFPEEESEPEAVPKKVSAGRSSQPR